MAEQTPVPTAGTAPQGDHAAPVASETTTTPPTGEQPGQPPGDPPAEPPKRIDGRLKRINELTYQLRESQRQGEAREQRLLGLIEQMQRQASPQERRQAPKLTDYEDLGQFIQDSIAHFSEATPKPTEKPKESTARETSDPRWDAEVDSLLSEGDEKHENFSEILAEDIGLSDPMKGFILFDADNRVDLAYHLATNPKEIRRIARLSPGKQIAELARMDDKLSAKQPPAKKLSSAPTPVEPVSGGTTAETVPAAGDMKAFTAARRKGVKLQTMIS